MSTDVAAPRFHIRTLGCKVNWAESETIAARLIEAGWESSVADAADIAIVNTCTVTGEADAKNRKLIRSLLKTCAGPVLVTGCAINIDADFYADIDARVVCERDKSRIAAVAEKLIARDADSGDRAFGNATHARFTSGTSPFRTRVDVKVQDGCDHACSYCIVHTARGPAHSAPWQDVVGRVEALANAGTQEVVLVGIDLGAYRDDNHDLAGLLDELMTRTDIGRVRIASVEPQSMTDDLIDALARYEGRVCRHVHLCLQSGSDKVLSEMNRPYSSGDFINLVERIRCQVPTMALSTDVIVGFPGETDEDFEATCRVVEQAQMMRLHVFKYSKRPGTPAAARDDQIDPRIKTERSQALIELGERLAIEDMQRRIGTEELVVVERPGQGTSESYHAALVPRDIPVGSLIQVRFADIDSTKSALAGMLV